MEKVGKMFDYLGNFNRKMIILKKRSMEMVEIFKIQQKWITFLIDLIDLKELRKEFINFMINLQKLFKLM